MYLIVIPTIIRGELESLMEPIESFGFVEDPPNFPGNAHPLLIWNKYYLSEEDVIAIAKNLSKNWMRGLKFNEHLRDGYVKSGHVLVHFVDADTSIWSELDDLDYLYDGISSTNLTYKEYGII